MKQELVVDKTTARDSMFKMVNLRAKAKPVTGRKKS
jgi:hypothetical protein